MATSTPNYGTATTITITLASLASSTVASGVGRQSNAVDNTSDLAVDSHVGGKINTGTTTANLSIEIWAFGSYDGTSFAGGAGSTDAGLTLVPTIKFLLRPIFTIWVPDTTARVYTWGPCSVAQAFGGAMPRKWGIWVLNSSGAALNATPGNHELKYTPIKFTST